MVEVEFAALKYLAAVLAGVLVALEDIVTSELNLLFRQPVEHHQQDHTRDANAERDSADAFWVWFLFRKVLPFAEIISLERTVARTKHSLGVTLEQQSKGTTGGTDVDRLP